MYRSIGSDLSERYSTPPRCFSHIIKVKNLKGTIDCNSTVLLEKKFHYFSTHLIRNVQRKIASTVARGYSRSPEDYVSTLNDEKPRICTLCKMPLNSLDPSLHTADKWPAAATNTDAYAIGIIHCNGIVLAVFRKYLED